MSAPSSGWWSGGFPDAERATKFQRVFLVRRMHLAEKFLADEERVALRMIGGFESWLDCLSKVRACDIIGKIKDLVERENIKPDEKDKSFSISSLVDSSKCQFCGGEVSVIKAKRKCAVCGKASFKFCF
jgi:hypothetical protein